MICKRVTCAVILRRDCVLLARRAPGQKHAGCWEFPGGKTERDETDAQCLEREIWEELGVRGHTGAHICDSRCVYEELALEILLCAYFFVPDDMDFDLRVHDAVRFFNAEELDALNLSAADRPVAQAVQKMLKRNE